MSQNLPILDELGEELQRAAERKLKGSSRHAVLRRAGEAVVFVLAALVAAVIAVIALGVHPRPQTPSAASGNTGQRGSIVDRTGRVLVASRAVLAVKLDASRLPHSRSARTAEMRHLERALSVAGLRPGTPFTRDFGTRLLAFNLAHRGQFPGVTVGRGWVRNYPLHGLAPQLLGTVAPIGPAELRNPRFAGVSPGTPVGQSGLEWYYDSSLRNGETLKLSLDVNLEQVGQAALAHSINQNAGSGGAFVAMNPIDGEIYAMGSLPTFDPNIFSNGPLPRSALRLLNSPTSNHPLINRAIQTAGPIGSTITPITAIAALQSGAWSIGDTFDDTGQFCVSGQCRHNPGDAAYGVVNLVDAIKVSDQVFFYNLGAVTNADPYTHPNGGALQQWARAFGIGQPTGIDLGGEAGGTLPTPAWRTHLNQLETECEKATGTFTGKPKHPGGCGIADGRPWSIGDNINLAVGQGDVQVTPVQLAIADAALANGGTIVRPHLGMDTQSRDGTVLQTVNPTPARHLNIAPQYLDAIRQGLRNAVSQPGGTSEDVFRRFPEPVYGMTGTAQYSGQQDYAWYAGFVPPSATTKPIVVVVTVQQGGFGAAAAAPVARQILSQWFLGRPGAWVVGHSRTL